ncbi:MAG: 23S rRNA (adenine(2503)-C(2))-methyltransferase RlmN [Pirellulales bacterium]
MVSIHDFDGVEQWRRRHKLDSQCLRRLRTAFYKKQQDAKTALSELPESARADSAKEIQFHALRLASRHDSKRDGASRLVFRTPQELLLETVILRMTSGRTALCLSTQVGCAANCDFCATGKMGIARNLAAAEILDQLVQAQQLLAVEGRRVRNLVFMGMGEPFHNEGQLHAALEVLTDSCAFNLNPRRMMISTVGIPEAMVRCARRWPEVRLALSLHSACPDVRRRLMPIAARYTLSELREALQQVTAIQQHEVMIEYLLLADINDTAEDARALAEYLRGIDVHINLIPYNPIAEAPHLAPSDAGRRAAFSAALKADGFPVTTRYSLGADIAAACGQLVRMEHREQPLLR